MVVDPIILTIVSAPGRICLGGESLDWMTGGSSVVATIPLRTFVAVNPRVDERQVLSIQCEGPFKQRCDIPLDNLGIPSGDRLDHAQLAAHVASQASKRPAAVSLSIRSAIPMNAGVSSSAAVTVAVIGALNAYWQAGLTTEDICALAFRVEDTELRTGAGKMDFYACGLGGLLSLNCLPVPPAVTRYSRIANHCRVLLVDTQTPHNTRKFLSPKRQRWLQGDPLLHSYATHVSEYVERLCVLLVDEKPNLAEIGSLLTACHILLRDCMHCSTDLLEDCISRCLAAGAYGAKLTGSGMGGCMFALAPQDRVAAIKHELTALPVKVYEFSFMNDGIRTERIE
jgi:mevalonate kinase